MRTSFGNQPTQRLLNTDRDELHHERPENQRQNLIDVLYARRGFLRLCAGRRLSTVAAQALADIPCQYWPQSGMARRQPNLLTDLS